LNAFLDYQISYYPAGHKTPSMIQYTNILIGDTAFEEVKKKYVGATISE
jgi:hypothetical protein